MLLRGDGDGDVSFCFLLFVATNALLMMSSMMELQDLGGSRLFVRLGGLIFLLASCSRFSRESLAGTPAVQRQEANHYIPVVRISYLPLAPLRLQLVATGGGFCLAQRFLCGHRMLHLYAEQLQKVLPRTITQAKATKNAFARSRHNF